MNIVPITLREANAFVKEYHRHHGAAAGCKFAIGIKDDGKLIGVAICGRPVSRYYDDGLTLEINRVCTIGTKNACSRLYGACRRIASAMGYKRMITYTLLSESGTSLKASNAVFNGVEGGEMWTGSRHRDNGVPKERKKRWLWLL